DTSADYLNDKYGLVSFTYGVILERGCHIEYSHIPKDPKPVRGYQLYGQLMKYVKDSNNWIDQCLDKIDYIKEAAENYNIIGSEVQFMPMITDLRQPDEYDRLIEEGYTIIRVTCPDHIRLERLNA